MMTQKQKEKEHIPLSPNTNPRIQQNCQLIQQQNRFKKGQKVYKVKIHMTQTMSYIIQKIQKNFNKSTPSIFNQIIQGPNQPIIQQSNQNTQQYFFIKILQIIYSQPNSNKRKISLFQNFKNRGKYDYLKYSFSRQKKIWSIIINKRYFFQQTMQRQHYLLPWINILLKSWQSDYRIMAQCFIKIQKQTQNQKLIKLQIVSIDIISITFDLIYKNPNPQIQMKRFRFRYSPYQFRNTYHQQKNGIQHNLSYVQILNSKYLNVKDNDFYNTSRLSFLDDVSTSTQHLWNRITRRFWLFYQINTLIKGSPQYDQFNRKALGFVNFYSIRMKKFQLIFPFTCLNKKIIDQKKQSSLIFTFYLDQHDHHTYKENWVQFKLTANITQHYNILQLQHKKQLFSRLSMQDYIRIRYFNRQKQYVNKSMQLFQFQMDLRFDDKIGKIFAKFCSIVSTYLDKVAFFDITTILPLNLRHVIPKIQQNQQNKFIQLISKTINYKQNQFLHTHTLSIFLCLKTFKQETQDHKHENIIDQLQLIKIIKNKTKRNQKQKKQQIQQRFEMIINDQIKKYLTNLIKFQPLRKSYNKIIKFIQSYFKAVYSPFKQQNIVIKNQRKDWYLTLIMTNISQFIQKNSNNNCKTQFNILTQDNYLFMSNQNQSDLFVQITFIIKYFKLYWIKRISEGFIILRLFNDKIQILRDFNFKTTIKLTNQFNPQNKKYLEKFNNQFRNFIAKEVSLYQSLMI